MSLLGTLLLEEKLLISLNDIKLLKKNRRVFNMNTRKCEKLKYSVEMKNGCIEELTKQEYKMIKKRLGDESNE